MTAPMSAMMIGRTSRTRSSCIGSIRKFIPDVCLMVNRDRRSAASVSTSRCADASVASSFRRPTTRRNTSLRDPVEKSMASGVQTSGAAAR